MTLLALSFVANIAITFAVTFAILRNHPSMREAYGPDNPARRILACIYLSIGLISGIGLVLMIGGHIDIAVQIALVLFPLQITYKLMTAIAVGLRHPVVISNLAVTGLLASTLLTLI